MSRTEYANRISYMLSLSDYTDNFVISNVNFTSGSYGLGKSITFYEHFVEWFKKHNDYIVVANTHHRIHCLKQYGMPEDKLILSTDFTKVRYGKSEEYKYVEKYLEEGKIILFNIADVRLLNKINFYFGLSKKNEEVEFTRENWIRSEDPYSNPWLRSDIKFDRIIHYSWERNNKYLSIVDRIEDIDKILENESK